MNGHADPFKSDGSLTFEATDPRSGERYRLDSLAPISHYGVSVDPLPGAGLDASGLPRYCGVKLTIEATILGEGATLYRAQSVPARTVPLHVAADELGALRAALDRMRRGGFSPADAGVFSSLLAEVERAIRDESERCGR